MIRGVGWLAVAVLCQPVRSAPPVPLGVADPVLTRLLTPHSVPARTYVVYRSERSIQTIAAALRAEDHDPAPGAWKAERQDVLDAFDGASRADRFRLAELYVGIHPLVARGSLVRDGRREGYTLISPYPDASMTRLQPGTMVIVFQVPF
jgi:hypothetical protein